MRTWALIEIGDTEAIDVFLRREDAEAALDDCLRDEPEWQALLRVIPDRVGRGRAFPQLRAC